MEEKSEVLSLEGLLSQVQLLLTSKKYLLSFQKGAQNELLTLENTLRTLFEEVARKVLKHFEQILLAQEEKIALEVSQSLNKLEKQLLDLKFKHSESYSSRDARLASILSHIDAEKQRLLDSKKCSLKFDTDSISEAFVQILASNVKIEVNNAQMSDQERIRREVAQSEDNRLIIQPLIPKIDVEEVKKKEPERKERKLSGLPQGSIVLIKTVQEQPKVGFQMSTPILITTIHKRMQGVVQKHNLNVEEVVNAKKLGLLYSLKYKIEVLEGWHGSVKKIEEVIKEGSFVKECSCVQQKAGEGCNIF